MSSILGEDKQPQAQEFLAGGGQMGDIIRSFDWQRTPLGTVASWPQSLRSALSICLNSNFPIAVYWGPSLILLYNDPWSPIPGNKHPWALGRPAIEVWPDIWQDIAPLFKEVFATGKATGSRDALLPMQRHGYTEECYFDFTFTPVYGEDGKVDGVFNAVIETTYRVINERRTLIQQKLVNHITAALSYEVLFRRAFNILQMAKEDIPFAFLYTVDKDSDPVLAAYTVPPAYEGLVSEAQWPFGDAQPLHVKDIRAYWPHAIHAFWPEPVREALVLPLVASNGSINGYLVSGLSPRRAYDAAYRLFLESVTASISNTLNNIRSFEEEKRRVEALSQIDKAKTAFFSNISHEFRTPLTLMLGPIQDALNDPATIPGNQVRLEVAHRNVARLLKLVNTLLDFSRIEAGRMQAGFHPVNLGALVKDLASTFRSAIEKAGLQLIVDIQELQEPVYVDVDMWEKILLNLLSNAFKHTHQGTITLRLLKEGNEIKCSVADTGVGIAAEELDHIFDRFYRIQHTGGRSQEGTGIGLSLVQELVRLHHGTISVQSRQGEGSIFTVTLPAGKAHLPAHQVSESAATGPLFHGAEIYIQEALQWLPAGHIPAPSFVAPDKIELSKKRVLLADDNTDMREYVSRLLLDQYDVTAVSNGKDALQMAKTLLPDLIVSDVMMPEMDGFELVKYLKHYQPTAHIPVILLSARAGEEATIEGLQSGADDYLVKPFSARELLSRIEANIKIVETRMSAGRQLYKLFMEAPVGIAILRGAEHRFELANALYLEVAGKQDVIGKNISEVFPEFKDNTVNELLDGVFTTGVPYIGREFEISLQRNGVLQHTFLNFVYTPMREIDGTITGVIVVVTDVTDMVTARKKLEENEQWLAAQVKQRTLDLEQSQAFLEAVLYTTSNGIAVYEAVNDEAGIIQDFKILFYKNELSAQTITPQDDLIGKLCSEVQPGIFYNGVFERFVECVGTGIPSRHEFEFTTGGVTSWYEYAIVRLNNGLTATFSNITEEKLDKLNLRHLNTALERSNTELEQFAHVASHDLREPLRKIKTFGSRLKDEFADLLPERAIGYLQKMDTAVNRMRDMIEGVLDYSSINTVEQRTSQVDLNEIVNSVADDLEILMQQKEANLHYKNLPVIEAHPVLIHQLFYNIINNALKFAKLQTPLLIDITAQVKNGEELQMPAGQYAAIAICDNGIGFRPDEGEKIFKTFTRLHSKDRYEGTGLGLALCKKIVERYNGRISASGQEGVGACFNIILPLG